MSGNTAPEARTVQTVVVFVGAIALLLVGGSIYLVHEVITMARITPTSVAVLASITGLAGTALGSLASMLVSTRPSPAPGDPTTFVADPGATVTVQPADDTPSPSRSGAKKTTHRRRARQAGLTDLQLVFLVLLAIVGLALIAVAVT